MKIGIVTFHFAHNYGALLQCYALKMFLQQKGFDVSVIDYAPDYHRSVYPATNSVFEKFICENIMPKPYGIDDKYDIIIYGSDTVWHPFDFSTFKGFDTAYFGKVFESGKNIAFSASANMKAYRQKDLLDLPALLQNFDAIAVRESLLKDFCNHIIATRYITLAIQPYCLILKLGQVSVHKVCNSISHMYLCTISSLHLRQCMILLIHLCVIMAVCCRCI